jgi:hypothetical protein
MRTFFSAALAILGASGAVAAVPSVAVCEGAIYADGNVFTYAGTSGKPLGGYPAKTTFPISLYVPDNTPQRGMRLMQKTGGSNFARYSDVLYIDASPHAYEPVGFKPAKKLSAAESDKWWGMPYGLLYWSPTTDMSDGTAPDGSWIGGGFVDKPVEGYPGLTQLYWNQTQWEEAVAGRIRPTGYFPPCWAETSSVIVDYPHP